MVNGWSVVKLRELIAYRGVACKKWRVSRWGKLHVEIILGPNVHESHTTLPSVITPSPSKVGADLRVLQIQSITPVVAVLQQKCYRLH